MKIKFGILLFLVFLGSFSIDRKCRMVFIIIPKDYLGKIMIVFDKKDCPNLKEKKGLYYAVVSNKGFLNTSTSFKDMDSMYFFVLQYDYKRNKVVLDSVPLFFPYSDWYSGKHTENLKNGYRNKEMYVGYHFHDSQTVQDSLYSFLERMGADTLFVEPGVKKINK